MQQDLFKPAPYRRSLRRAPSEAVDELNKRNNLSGAARFESVEAAIKRISETKRVHPTRLPTWAEHPDERVRVAFLEKHREEGILSYSGRGDLNEMIVTAMNDAKSEDMLWTPVLDAIAVVREWRAKGHHYGTTNAEYGSEELVMRLVPWIEEQDNSADLLDLLQFKYAKIQEVVGQAAALMDDPLFARLMQRDENVKFLVKNPVLEEPYLGNVREWVIGQLLRARNTYHHYRGAAKKPTGEDAPGNHTEALNVVREYRQSGRKFGRDFIEEVVLIGRGDVELHKEAVQTQAAAWAFDILLDAGSEVTISDLMRIYNGPLGKQGVSVHNEGRILKRGDVGPKELRAIGLQTTAMHVLLTVTERLKGQDSLVRDRVLDDGSPQVLSLQHSLEQTAEGRTEVYERFLQDIGSWNTKSYYDSSGYRRAFEALKESSLTTEELKLAYEKVKDESGVVAQLMKHQSQTLEFLRYVAQDSSFYTVRESLAAIPEAREDKVIREVLLSSRAEGVMKALVADLRDEEIEKLTSEIAARDPEWTIEFIKTLEPEKQLLIQPTTIAPIFKSGDRELAKKAIFLLGELRDAAQKTVEKKGKNISI